MEQAWLDECIHGWRMVAEAWQEADLLPQHCAAAKSAPREIPICCIQPLEVKVGVLLQDP